MLIHYDSKFDLLDICLEPSKQNVTNIQVTEDIVLDMGEGDKLVGIEILDASKHVNLQGLMPIEYEKTV